MTSSTYSGGKGDGVMRGYIHLAAEICNRGIAEHDELFLKSKWFEYLTHMVCLYNNNPGKCYPDIMLR